MPATAFGASASNLSRSGASISSFSDSQIANIDSIAAFETVRADKNLSNDTIIKGMVENLLIGKIQAENSYKNIAFDVALDTQKRIVDDSVTFFIKKTELFKEMRSSLGIEITDETLKYTFSPIAYDGDIATVDVSEWYEFQIGTIDDRSTVVTEYHITLAKDDDGVWAISTITSNDWFDQEHQNQPFDVLEEIYEMTQQPQTSVTEAFGPAVAAATITTTDYTVKAANVSNYADTFATLGYNGIFTDQNPYGGDCQSFASQCLLAGLGFSMDATAISNKAAPADNVGSYTWAPYTSAFINCISFVTYLGNNTSETGLYGTVTTTTSSSVTVAVGTIVEGPGSTGPMIMPAPW